MFEWIVPLSSALPASLVGRKAAVLGRLLEAGFLVPRGICITTETFRAAPYSEPGHRCFPDGLREALALVLPINTPLAVRSSAVLEDLPEVSLAGRYTTRLNVTGIEMLEQAVLDCWYSYDSVPDSGKEGDGMAVLVQPMLDTECAGVCFSVDPVRLRPDLVLVVSAWGLGVGVVSGTIPVDTFRLRRTNLYIEDSVLADKHTALRFSTSGGVTQVPNLEDMRGIPSLTETWLERVGQYGLAIEQLFGAPQDVEWAVAAGQLWILQSRPITALTVENRQATRFPIPWENEDEPRHYWWLERARDGVGSPLLPAELDFVRIKTKGGHDSVYYGGMVGTRWRKMVNGRVYMAAVNSPNTPGHVRVYGTAQQDLYERLKRQDITIWEYWGPEIVRATDRQAAFDAREADGSTLADHLEDVIAAATRHWMIHTMTGPRPIRSVALRDSYARMAGLPPEKVADELPFLLVGNETIQTRLVEALYDLACLALESPQTSEAFALGYSLSDEVDTATPRPEHLESFAPAFRRLIAEYGDRLCYQQVPGYPVELQLPWREAPGHVWKMIAAYLPLAQQRGRIDQDAKANPVDGASFVGQSPREIRLKAQRAADLRVESLCNAAISIGIDSALVDDFRRTLAYARRNAAYLDEHNHYIDQVSEGQFVQALLYSGRWLTEQGCLPSPFDVFWLNAEEVLTALRDSSTRLEAVLTERRMQFSEWQAMIPPACLGLPNSGLPERPEISTDKLGLAGASEPFLANTLIGETASRGSASGRARLTRGDLPPADVSPGDVLVAPFATPLLIPFLPAITALILDYGSPGDHFAITAREFGIPVVCATLHATQMIPEGAWVIVDANTGLVTWA